MNSMHAVWTRLSGIVFACSLLGPLGCAPREAADEPESTLETGSAPESSEHTGSTVPEEVAGPVPAEPDIASPDIASPEDDEPGDVASQEGAPEATATAERDAPESPEGGVPGEAAGGESPELAASADSKPMEPELLGPPISAAAPPPSRSGAEAPGEAGAEMVGARPETVSGPAEAATTVAAEADEPPQVDVIPTRSGDLVIRPIRHASLLLEHAGKRLCVDPAGDRNLFKDLGPIDVILITDTHGDHLDSRILDELVREGTALIAPAAAAEKLKEQEVTTIANGETREIQGIRIEAVPMYNLTEDRLRFHEKGRGNGYLLTLADLRVYISGDTEDIPEMRQLKDIDIAFVCMNLPFTMTVEQAADAVRAFRPGIVYPYHYRGRDGMSDLERFKTLVGGDLGIEVRIRDWYPQE